MAESLQELALLGGSPGRAVPYKSHGYPAHSRSCRPAHPLIVVRCATAHVRRRPAPVVSAPGSGSTAPGPVLWSAPRAGPWKSHAEPADSGPVAASRQARTSTTVPRNGVTRAIPGTRARARRGDFASVRVDRIQPLLYASRDFAGSSARLCAFPERLVPGSRFSDARLASRATPGKGARKRTRAQVLGHPAPTG
jgi:hypothetical protein